MSVEYLKQQLGANEKILYTERHHWIFFVAEMVAALLDVEEPVDAVTIGSVRHELRPLGVLTSVSSGQLDPSAGDLAVTAGWGHGGKGDVTMPGRGRVVERHYTDAELAAFREGLADLGLTYDQLTACLGGACYDVYLNDVAYAWPGA